MIVLDKTHSLEKTVSWASFVWKAPNEGSLFFFKNKFYSSVIETIITVYLELLDFKRGSDLIHLLW